MADLDWSDGLNPNQPFVMSNGDPTGFGFHGYASSEPIAKHQNEINLPELQ